MGSQRREPLTCDRRVSESPAVPAHVAVAGKICHAGSAGGSAAATNFACRA